MLYEPQILLISATLSKRLSVEMPTSLATREASALRESSDMNASGPKTSASISEPSLDELFQVFEILTRRLAVCSAQPEMMECSQSC